MKTKKISKTIIYAGSFLLLSANSCKNQKSDAGNKEQEPLNVLFIMVDDLRPELGCYGNDVIHSPNIDKLASEGVVFNRAYCNIPVCGASRASLLTGTRPRRNSFLSYKTTISGDRPGIPTLGKHFRENGYHTIHNGKVMHHKNDAKGSWNEEWWPESNTDVTWRDYADPENINIERTGERGYPYEKIDVPDTTYKDGKLAKKTIQDLIKLKETGKPFFLASGFFKPHLPFNAPEKYWDLYNPDDIKLPPNDYKPENAPEEAMHNWGELRQYYNIPEKGSLNDNLAHKLKHGYYACVSYIDAQIGMVLSALDSLGMRENTAVVLIGDHGWNIREHGLWCKHCNFNTSLRTPLIYRGPGAAKGEKTNAITELVDIYPTLCKLTGIPIPGHTEGNSFHHVLNTPDKSIDGIAVARWRKGYTLIRDQYFYTEWFNDRDSTFARMLYDHQIDPGENTNIAGLEENKELVKKLSKQLYQNLGEKFDD